MNFSYNQCLLVLLSWPFILVDAYQAMLIILCLAQELLYLYGFVVDNNPDDYLMVCLCKILQLVQLLYRLLTDSLLFRHNSVGGDSTE